MTLIGGGSNRSPGSPKGDIRWLSGEDDVFLRNTWRRSDAQPVPFYVKPARGGLWESPVPRPSRTSKVIDATTGDETSEASIKRVWRKRDLLLLAVLGVLAIAGFVVTGFFWGAWISQNIDPKLVKNSRKVTEKPLGQVQEVVKNVLSGGEKEEVKNEEVPRGYVIRLGLFSSRAAADELKELMQEQNVSTQVVVKKSKADEEFLVQSDSYPTRREAATVAEFLKKKFALTTAVSKEKKQGQA